jgi:hypothetical protein
MKDACKMESDIDESGKAKGGHARADKLPAARRTEIARLGAVTRWSRPEPVLAKYGAADRPLKIGDISIPCYVLADGTRVLAQRGLQSGIGLSEGGVGGGARKIAVLMNRLTEKGIDTRDLAARANSPIWFIPPHGGNPASGYEATILPDLCAVLIEAGRKGALDKRIEHIADRAATLQHGFATLGIIALVDEATGYQKERAKDALSKLLEAFIAKELQPWVPTFPVEFYEHMFRLRGLPFPSSIVRRPQYFGTLTNDVVYKRLAPGVLKELRTLTPRDDDGRPTAKYFQSLTSNVGYPKLKEHLGAVVAFMKISSNWADFLALLNMHYPRFGDTMELPFPYDPKTDDGKGI